jgi:glutamate carboxypeptidase
MSKVGVVAAGLSVYALAIATGIGVAQPADSIRERVQRERAPLLETLRDLVSIESGSRDIEGLNRIGAVIADKLRAAGAEVEIVPPSDIYRMEDTPPQLGSSVVARVRGTGARRILLLAHMDTVYLPGMLAHQPFRIDGSRARGLGIADDKHGVALAIHALAVLRAMDIRDYGLITVLINADEEVSSPGSRSLITRLGAEHDVVFSLEGAGEDDRLRLTTSGIGAAMLAVTGRASHAGSAPEAGRNALYELAHQLLQTRDLSEPATGLKLNWTTARGGTNRNVIPERAEATADIRVLDAADYDVVERRLRERIRRQLIPDTKVELTFERRRPPLRATAASRTLARHAQAIYAEIGRTLHVGEVSPGGGTDAAFAALETSAPVIEGFGLRGGGAHSNGAEWIDLDSIEPRLYLLTRMIIDVARGQAPLGP